MGEAKVMVEKVDHQTNYFSFHQEKTQPTNFLQRFSPHHSNLKQTQFSISIPSKRPPEIDLNLRLSLGGIYSGNTKENPLTRSSSIAAASHEELEKSLPKSFVSLARSHSLPAEVESCKRVVMNVKELRVMRRFEAKKRVVEKQKASEKEKLLVMEGPPSSPSKIPAWAAASAAKSPALNRAIDKIKEGFRNLEGLEGLGRSMVPSKSLTSLEQIKTEPGITSETISDEKCGKPKAGEMKCELNPTKKAKLCNNGCIQENGMNVMKKMPSVSTTGDGPNGRKIEGFLYKYMKGQVSIVCVCHGSFLSPEEFVKHAGRKDVTNPMRHINVCSTSFSY